MNTLVLESVGNIVSALEQFGLRVGCNKNAPTGHPYRDVDPRQMWARKYLSWRFVRGEGLEIGALHFPLPLVGKTRAKYVDFMSVEAAREHYPELAGFDLVTPDFVENGEELPSIEAASQDFIIANHFIEHCENPIATIANFLTKLRSGGTLFMAVPMRDFTFDKSRELTTVDHLLEDFRNRPERSRLDHYRDWVRNVDHVGESWIEEAANKKMASGYSIHFHVWSFESFQKFLECLLQEVKLNFSVEAAVLWRYNPFEAVYVLKKG